MIAGYSLIDVKSKDEAVAWIKRWSPLDGGGNVQLELGQLFSPEDFGEQAVEDVREAEELIIPQLRLITKRTGEES